MEWESAGIVMASQHRQNILRTLKVSVATPKDLSIKLKLHLSQVTRSLREMEKLGLVECKTPALRKGRIYAITKKGVEALSRVP